MRSVYQGVGSLAFPPEPLLKIVLYEYLQGRCSPAQWHRDCKEHDALKWLGRGLQPSRTAWYLFRDRIGPAIESLHEDLVRQTMAEGHVSAEKAAQDGTTFRAYASRHRVVNQKTLNKRLQVLQEALQADEQSRPFKSSPQWMPETPDGRLDLAARMEEALGVLNQRLENNAKKPKSKRQREDRIFVSLSEPQAVISRDKEKVFCPLYTSQFMVDFDSLMVLGYSLAAEATDVGTLTPMIDQVQRIVGGNLRQVVTDATYATVLDLQDCRDRDIDLIALVQENSRTHQKQSQKAASEAPGAGPINREQFRWLKSAQTYKCPAGHRLEYQWTENQRRHGGRTVAQHRYRCPPEHCQRCPLASRCVKDPSRGRTIKRLEGQELLDAQRLKMQQPESKSLLRQRNQVVERAFADAKRHRSFKRLHGRGLNRAKTEVGLLVLAQNILTAERLRSHAVNPGETKA